MGKQVLVISSYDRTDPNSNPSRCSIDVSKHNISGNSVALLSCEFVNAFYNLNSSSNIMSGVTVIDSAARAWPLGNVSVSAGSYTAPQLCCSLQSALNTKLLSVNPAAAANFFSVSFNTATNYTTITSWTSNWGFTITPDNSLSYQLGIRNGVSTTTNNYMTEAATDCRSYPVIMLRCSLIQGNYVSPQGVFGCLSKLQNSQPFGYTNFYKAVDDNLERFDIHPNTISSIDFQFCDEYGYYLNNDLWIDWSASC